MKRGHIPVRTCVGCRRRRPQQELLRLVLGPGGLRVGAREGRGFYICRDESCVEKARKRKSMGSGVGRPLTESEIDKIKRVMSRQNGLDGECKEGVICSKSSGGVAFA